MDKNILLQKIHAGMTLQKIADEAGCSRENIRYWVKNIT